MKVLVCGGRSYRNGNLVGTAMKAWNVTELVVGYNPNDKRFQGADQLAYEYAKANGIPGCCFPAAWGQFGKHGKGDPAGPLRNMKMLDRGKPEMVLAFPGGRGTDNMVALAKEGGVRVVEVVDPT